MGTGKILLIHYYKAAHATPGGLGVVKWCEINHWAPTATVALYTRTR